MKNRVILHSDLNGFFASVELLLDPRLRGKAVAVSGSSEERHGIVLAKSEEAKAAGIRTGMVNFEALRLCPELILVRPHYEQYKKYSRLARSIYERYTDLVEPFGMDECFLDVTACGIFGTGEEIAEKIRRDMKDEIGLTVSIGVSFNKVFAKLGSDMKKPDAITVITADDFKLKVWPQPVGNMIYCGPGTAEKLRRNNINTIGELACSDPGFIKSLLGKHGEALWIYANGLDSDSVKPSGYEAPLKSVGHGVTCTSDLKNDSEVRSVIVYLSREVAHRLRKHRLKAGGVHLSVRDSSLSVRSCQMRLDIAVSNPEDISAGAIELFEKNYKWERDIRSLTVTAVNTVPEGCDDQLSFFTDIDRIRKHEKLFTAVDRIRERFGNDMIKEGRVFEAEHLGGMKIPHGRYEKTLQGI